MVAKIKKNSGKKYKINLPEQSPNKKINRVYKKIFLIFLFLILGSGAGISVLLVYLGKNLPNPAQFNSRQIIQSTKIYDRTGAIQLYEIHGEEKRTFISFDKIPENVKKATLAIEDDNFYNHSAFDWRSIIRAITIDILRGKIVQGGSTITQQLAKNAFLTPERTLARKLKELILSFQLERIYAKNEIFNFYLNQVPYGSNAYGIEAASKTFFNKSSLELNLNEAALLASLPKAPGYYSPYGSHTEELEERKNYALQRMKDLGFISEEEKENAQKTKLIFAPPITTIKAPHFSLMIKDYLINRYGEELVEKGGLKVITTLDWPMQELAEKTVLEGAVRNEKLYDGKNAALVAQDAKTGQILTLVGSRDYFNQEIGGNFNVPIQGLRQPGSALKPFAYIAAFQKGFTPDTVVFDAPTEFTDDDPECPLIFDYSTDKNENDKCYHPENFDERFRGPVTFREALAQSINVPAVKILYLAGLNNTLELIHKFGVSTLNERGRYGLSLVLGGGEIKLIDLVGAYSVFSQEGIKRKQSFILEIKNANNQILEKYEDQSEPVIASQYAKIINDILSDKDLRTPLFTASLNLTTFPDQEIALKTGTTNDYRDAWAIGYSPSLTVGVWAGNNDNVQMQKKGGSILAAVPIWHSFMQEILKKYPSETFIRPDPLIVEKPILRGEKIIKHKVYLDVRTGQPATAETPIQLILEKDYPQIHSLLYYADKNNPAGPIPQNPENDGQFDNWENAVLNWGRQNLPDFNNYNQITPDQNIILNQPIFKPKITDFLPNNGSFLTDEFFVKANIKSTFEMYKIELYINNNLLDKKLGSLGRNYAYAYQVNYKLNPQNEIKLKVWDVFNNQDEYQIIIFK